MLSLCTPQHPSSFQIVCTTHPEKLKSGGSSETPPHISALSELSIRLHWWDRGSPLPTADMTDLKNIHVTMGSFLSMDILLTPSTISEPMGIKPADAPEPPLNETHTWDTLSLVFARFYILPAWPLYCVKASRPFLYNKGGLSGTVKISKSPKWVYYVGIQPIARTHIPELPAPAINLLLGFSSPPIHQWYSHFGKCWNTPIRFFKDLVLPTALLVHEIESLI